MKMKGFLWVSGYAVFMIGYFLILTILLPSTLVYEPDWIRVGNYAEYRVEEWRLGYDELINGTYTWRIVSVYHVDGRTVVRVNQTYVGTTGEGSLFVRGHTGIADVNATEGVANGLLLWFTRYYNDHLVDRIIFRGVKDGDTFEGCSIEKTSVQGEVRSCIRFTTFHDTYGKTSFWYTRYWFDKATGILLRIHHNFRGRYSSDVLLESTNIRGELDSSKAILDLFLVSPLFVLPLTGATIGLLFLRRRGYGFSRDFWMGFVFFNGIILAFLSNWPLKFVFLLLFWIGILVTAIFLINRFAFSIITQAK